MRINDSRYDPVTAEVDVRLQASVLFIKPDKLAVFNFKIAASYGILHVDPV